MDRIAKRLFEYTASCLWGGALLLLTSSAGQAQEIAGPLERFIRADLGTVDMAVIVLAMAVTTAIAAYEFARDEVTVLKVPTMPKYTVARSTYWSFNAIYVLIILIVFGIVMERYEDLRQVLAGYYSGFEKLPDGSDVLTISIGSVALVAAFHYLRVPNTQIGPAWLLFRLRRLLHKRARIPDDAQVLAKQFLSDDPGIFEVPPERHEETATHPKVRAVSPEDFRAAPNTIDYQWAVLSYLYMLGHGYDAKAPFSSFISNEASKWPQIVKTYNEVSAKVALVKRGAADEVTQAEAWDAVQDLRSSLGTFHACLHLFAISNEAVRAERLKAVGLKQHAVFFIIGRSFLAKLLAFIVFGIAVPPLAFWLFSVVSGSETFQEFAKPSVIGQWILFGSPMYLLPIAMVMGMKRLMRTAWPIRATRACVSDAADPKVRQRAEFKWDIYLLSFALSFAIAALPLLIYNQTVAADPLVDQASYYFALSPAATATALAVLIDFDVVDRGTAITRPLGRGVSRTRVLIGRAAGLALLLGSLVFYLSHQLTNEEVSTLVVYAVTAAFMGAMIGLQTDFHRNCRTV